MNFSTRAALAAGLLLVLAFGGPACAGSPASTPPDPTETPAPAPPLPGDFTIRAYTGADRLGGETVLLSSIVGKGQPVVLNFWGGLCPPCRAEMPGFQAVYETYADRVLFLGVDVGPFVGLGGRQDARDLIAELEVTYPNGWTFNSSALKDYEVRSIPRTVFFSGDGRVVRVWTGAIPEPDLVELVEALLAS